MSANVLGVTSHVIKKIDRKINTKLITPRKDLNP